MRKSTTGFTIVELLIVIVVIAILAAISIVAYNGIQNRARASAASSAAAQAARKVATHAITNDEDYPAALSDVGVVNTGDTTYQYRFSNTATPKTFCVTATTGTASYYVSNTQTTPVVGACPGHGAGGAEVIVNLLPNPSAESGGSAWWSNNHSVWPAAFDTVIKRSGDRSRSSSSSTANTILLSLFSVGAIDSMGVDGIPITAAGPYTMSAHIRADVPHRGEVTLAARVGSTWQTLPSCGTTTGTTGAWTRVSCTATVPVGADRLRPVAYVHALSSQPAGTKAWVDDAMLVQGTDTGAYADGNSPGWIWDGTPHTSTSRGPRL